MPIHRLTNIMTHIKDILHNLSVAISPAHPSPTTEGGTTEQNPNLSTIHNEAKPIKLYPESILAQSPATTQANRGLNAGIFAAIGGAV